MRIDELKHYDEDTLVHFGVKGMKWGVRKAERVQDLMRKEDYGGHIWNQNQARLECVCTTQ